MRNVPHDGRCVDRTDTSREPSRGPSRTLRRQTTPRGLLYRSMYSPITPPQGCRRSSHFPRQRQELEPPECCAAGVVGHLGKQTTLPALTGLIYSSRATACRHARRPAANSSSSGAACDPSRGPRPRRSPVKRISGRRATAQIGVSFIVARRSCRRARESLMDNPLRPHDIFNHIRVRVHHTACTREQFPAFPDENPPQTR